MNLVDTDYVMANVSGQPIECGLNTGTVLSRKTANNQPVTCLLLLAESFQQSRGSVLHQ